MKAGSQPTPATKVAWSSKTSRSLFTKRSMIVLLTTSHFE